MVVDAGNVERHVDLRDYLDGHGRVCWAADANIGRHVGHGDLRAVQLFMMGRSHLHNCCPEASDLVSLAL